MRLIVMWTIHCRSPWQQATFKVAGCGTLNWRVATNSTRLSALVRKGLNNWLRAIARNTLSLFFLCTGGFAKVKAAIHKLTGERVCCFFPSDNLTHLIENHCALNDVKSINIFDIDSWPLEFVSWAWRNARTLRLFLEGSVCKTTSERHWHIPRSCFVFSHSLVQIYTSTVSLLLLLYLSLTRATLSSPHRLQWRSWIRRG